METRPPVLIEAVVRLLLPPASREHVLGDLSERYTSPHRYVAEAVRTLPFVVASRIRRTTSLVGLLLPGLIFMLAFSAGPGQYFWIRGAIPTVAVLLSLTLRDAYRVPDLARAWAQGFVDIAVVTGFVLMSQAILMVTQPEWMIADGGAARFLLNLVLLLLLRVQNPIPGPFTRGVSYGATMSLATLHREISAYEQGIRRAVGIEIVVGGLLVPIFAGIALLAPAMPMPIRLGFAMTAVGGVFVISRMRARLKVPPIPNDDDFSQTVRHYQTRLEHQHQSLRTAWRWYGLPLGLGPMLIFAVAAGGSATPLINVTLVVGGFIAISLFFHRVLFARQARSLRQRIDALAVVTERQ
jgi:hypothetical protein